MMIHIYKVYRAAAGALLLTATLAACTDSREPLQENETPREGMFFSVTATQGEGAETRVEYELNGDQGMNVTWAAGDKIYVGTPSSDAFGNINSVLSSLDIATDGVGQTTAQFEGEVNSNHLPANGETLYAFYGKADKIDVAYGDITYSYDGQRQTANGNMENAAEYDFMEASTEYNATPGFQHRFSFSHVGSMMKFMLYGLEGQTVKKLTLSAYDGSGPFADGYQSVSLELGTGSGFLVGNGKTLDAYLMVEPTTGTAGKNLVLYVTTTDGKNFATLLTGGNIDAGKLYTIDATLTEYKFAGAGTSATPYKITDAGDLTKLAIMTNSGMMKTEGLYFKLTANIDMATGAEGWLPIGKINNGFNGIFSGAKTGSENYSISNLPGKTAGAYAGLFGFLRGATIKNVTVSGEIAISGAKTSIYAGGIAGYAWNSTIADCNSNCKIDISTTSVARAGGIVGYSGGTNVTNCTNTGKVSSSKYSGGIIGYAQDSGEITGCTNSGEITSANTSYPAGGMIGYLYMGGRNQSVTLTDCTHSGSSHAQGAAGSIIGSYEIGSSASGCSITIINGANTESLTPGSGTSGQWPASN